MLRLDPHIHSRFSPDSCSKIDDILKIANKRNLDIIAISDHNTVEGNKYARSLKQDDILIIPSIEISSRDGHILGFGCEEEITQGLPPAETIDLIHDHAGLAIIPHPFCFYRHGLLHKTDEEINLDAIETKNARFIVGYCNNKALKLSKKYNIPALGASDSHYYKFVGDCYTKIDCEKDIDSVLKAIVKGKTKVCGKGTSNIQLSKYLFNKNILKKIC